MPTLVTGGTGFIGTRVARHLAEAGEKIICLDVSPNGDPLSDLKDQVKIYQGDITAIEELIAIIQKFKINRIIHLAVQRERLHSAMKISAMGTNCVFEAARLTGVKRVAFASSAAYHGPQEAFGNKAVTEDDHGYPTIVYGAIKWLNEFMAGAYNAQYHMEIIAVRLSLVYGWGSRGGLNWTNDLIGLPALGKQAKVPHRSTHGTCLIHVDDVAEIFKRVVTKDKLAYQVFHTGGHSCTLGEMADAVRDLIPGADIIFDEQAPEIPFVYLIDNSRLKTELAFTPRDLKDGLRDVINRVRSGTGLSPLD